MQPCWVSLTVGPNPTDHPCCPGGQPQRLVRQGRWKKTHYPLLVEPWITRAAVVCSLLLKFCPPPRGGGAYAETSSESGMLGTETSEAMPSPVGSYCTGTMSCFNSRQPSEVAICVVPWPSDPVGFGSRRTWPKKGTSGRACPAAQPPTLVWMLMVYGVILVTVRRRLETVVVGSIGQPRSTRVASHH